MSLSNLASTVRESLSRFRSYRTTVRELHSLDDRELADLGIARGNIESLARQSIR